MKMTKWGYVSPVEIQVFSDLDKFYKKGVSKKERLFNIPKKNKYDSEAWKKVHWIHK